MARKKVTSVPALADWGAVDNALRDIRECQHTLAEMAVQRDRQIDSIKADYAQGALPLQNRVKALESEVKAYVDLHRAELDGKSRALNFGTVPCQQQADACQQPRGRGHRHAEGAGARRTYQNH